MNERKADKCKRTAVDIGSAIQEKLKESKLSVVWFAEQIGCSRTNVYKMFGKQSINTDDLMRISEVLCFDFCKLYSNKLNVKKSRNNT